jgi:hypothetical protein
MDEDAVAGASSLHQPVLLELQEKAALRLKSNRRIFLPGDHG